MVGVDYADSELGASGCVVDVVVVDECRLEVGQKVWNDQSRHRRLRLLRLHLETQNPLSSSVWVVR